MKVIAINGIGNAKPGWSGHVEVAHILGIPPNSLVEFVYEDLMERNWLNQLLVWGARAAAAYYANPAVALAANYVQDYVDDILVYFLMPGVRKKILKRLSETLKQHPNAVIVSFSLGTVVAYETLKNYPGVGGKPILLTLGSTLGSPPLESLVKQFLKVPNKQRPLVTDWLNVYSPDDILSGYIEDLGCAPQDQFKVTTGHQMQPYLDFIKSKFPTLFS